MQIRILLILFLSVFGFNCVSGEMKVPTRRVLSQIPSNKPGVIYRFYIDLEEKSATKNNIFGVERVYQGNDSSTGEAFFKFYFYQEAGIELCTYNDSAKNYECKDLEIIFKQKNEMPPVKE
ncbi:MAG TPA: hypothetical protein PK079_13445 [Leptospiraceae bacterium]|nr:hypothetical protein [Leptospiraceae bacterium]HMW05303.1 hypothetical protein [Leptospiraceae bacterium]HMX34172.1 hypothetical protein [Leptospiraceae bacterium]HMY31499.1 hypothetical protein [Leptospiraceae bacterium]HMZ66432.1 hypothetical protein [Leptospiraceae bacterium]